MSQAEVETSTLASRAWANLHAQAASGCERFFSLHAMWRACGSPMDRSPSRWLALASPLVEGVAQYRANLVAAIPGASEPEVADARKMAFKVEPEDRRKMELDHEFPGLVNRIFDENYQVGDTMADEELAKFYARFLDDLD